MFFVQSNASSQVVSTTQKIAGTFPPVLSVPVRVEEHVGEITEQVMQPFLAVSPGTTGVELRRRSQHNQHTREYAGTGLCRALCTDGGTERCIFTIPKILPAHMAR